ncbi:leukemia inhibitory factor receptor-like [Hippocampus zosterae]|uniref:leukemia inhibitory factor receptor-like n=1 Tax=Hippocampus zosterae TaxID=109293 RepID=UPI00223E0D57|nr:leukemia inhibitory factor receptor-like [Hippocampus zosterae]
MIAWLLLVSLSRSSAQDAGVFPCGPRNVTVSASDQLILLTWEDDPSCTSRRHTLTYELEVLIADQPAHHEEVAVSPDQMGSPHSWSWSPHLALECAPFTLKLRSRSHGRTSPWQLERIGPGHAHSLSPEVYPRDKVFRVGTQATFCCVLPTGQALITLNVSGDSSSNWVRRKIGNRTHSLTVDLVKGSVESGANVICETQTEHNGACAYIGYPPADHDLTCETRDFQSVECLWTVGRNTHLALKSPTTYRLLGSTCAKGSAGRCSHKVRVDFEERDWILTAQNQLGTVNLTDRADLMRRVHMFAPQEVKVSSVNARSVRLEWNWAIQMYDELNVRCQLKISDNQTSAVRECLGVALRFAVLDDLIPNWPYEVTMRCGTAQHFWKWSEWSSSVEFLTMGDVPDALDVWMQGNDSQTIITWKVLPANQSHGNIIDYEVTWEATSERRNKSRVLHPKRSLALSLDATREHVVSVTARNKYGNSSPSTITIPVLNRGSGRVKSSKTQGSHGGFNLSWSAASPMASCGYIVDWCPSRGPCTIDWLRVPPSQTNVCIFSKNFREGVRYMLSIYGCTRGAPVLLERREGYVKEKIIPDGLFRTLNWKQRDMDVEVSWDPVALQEQSAFIQGYILYYGQNNSSVMNISTDDPRDTSLTARNLQINSYTFTVKANTTVGQCGATSITVTLNSLTDNLIKAVGITIATIFVLLCLIVILCYRNWECIKLKVCPPIPMPVLKDKWMTSLTKKSCRPVFVEMSHHTEAELMAIPELHCKSEAPALDCSYRANGCFGEPVENLSARCAAAPCLLPLLPPPPTPPPPLSSSLPKDGRLNPSYNLSSTDSLVEGSHGYQPQKQKGQLEEASDTPLPCVFTYIPLPSE